MRVSLMPDFEANAHAFALWYLVRVMQVELSQYSRLSSYRNALVSVFLSSSYVSIEFLHLQIKNRVSFIMYVYLFYSF
jgi:hypothetical protein